ncbi:Sua5/YciO/YrdC/YwlC family protein [Ferriphaselus sp. R-1]|uniref:L-threonylcarbamoyladenylate synthase n=1 Tax=Ferriphaselus sp. R-1 TaxID=1485544 RepID=UPI000A53303B|nr:Sua5/YciO/YrdC/YwlC family protein [Ferriphaselus sp. R-1]
MVHPSPAVIAHLKRGGLVAYPTESCYGFGCDPRNRDAVLRLLKLKGRPQRKGLILIASAPRQLRRYLQPLDAAAEARLVKDGAQAITYLMPVRPSCPRWLRGEHDTLAVRLTAHPEARELCRRAGMALVSTSANLGGRRATRSYAECQRLFGGSVQVLPGRVGRRRKPSTIRAWVGGRIVRN